MKDVSMINRQSNIELLRIIAILAIICHHVLVHGVGIYKVQLSEHDWLYSFVNCLCYTGVNIFILISGYFSIRFSWQKLWHLFLMCAVVAGLGYLWHCYQENMSIGRNFIYTTIFAFSRSGLWYVLPYVCLFLLSPFINSLLEQLSKSDFTKLLIVLIVISCYFGWFWQNDVNKNGFCLMQFVTMYAIGFYVKRYDICKIMRILAWGGVIFAFVIMQMLLVYYLLRVEGRLFPPVPFIYAYNSPFLIIASVGCLCMFLKMEICSKVINFVAKTTFGVYLIHCNQYVWNEWIEALRPIYMNSFVGVIGCVLIIYVITAGLDIAIRYVLVNPLHKYTIKLIDVVKKHVSEN